MGDVKDSVQAAWQAGQNLMEGPRRKQKEASTPTVTRRQGRRSQQCNMCLLHCGVPSEMMVTAASNLHRAICYALL